MKKIARRGSGEYRRKIDKERTDEARSKHNAGLKRLAEMMGSAADGAAMKLDKRINGGVKRSATRKGWTRPGLRAQGKEQRKARQRQQKLARMRSGHRA